MVEGYRRFHEIGRTAARRGADLCLITIEGSLWVGGTALAALGCLLLVAILVADGHPTRFFLHLQNLSTHYLAADGAARLRFDCQLAGFYIGIVALLSIARWPIFATRLRAALDRRADNA